MLPADAPEGTTFPIDLNFFIGDESINGYTHILRVAPLSATVSQVLDTFYGALGDVGIGFQSDHAQALAQRVRKMALREQQRGESSGCFGLLWKIVRPKSAWRSEITSLSDDSAALAQSLGQRSEPESQVVRQHLDQLVSLLRNSKSTPAPEFLEQIRNVADRVQERAGRLVP